jgi:membrane protein
MQSFFSNLYSGTRRGWELTVLAFGQWWNDDAFRLASSLAFYTIFSLAPILLISVGLASVIFSEAEAKKQVIQQIELMTGSEGAVIARQVLNNLGRIGGNVKAILGGIITVLIGSTAVFVNLQSALNYIWKVKPAPGSSMWIGLIRDRIRSFGIVLSVGFLLIVSMGFSALVSGMQELGAQRMEGFSWVWNFSNIAISFIITTLLFAMIYKYLPDVRIGWKDVLIGAAITSGLFSAGKYLIGLYLGRTAIGSTYGAAGSFVVLLIWIYYSALISFLGAEFTRVYARRYGTRIIPEPHAVRIDSDADSAIPSQNPKRKRKTG